MTKKHINNLIDDYLDRHIDLWRLTAIFDEFTNKENLVRKICNQLREGKINETYFRIKILELI